MSENIEKAPNVPPFVTFVTSAVPMVFDNSLSYYEALCALWKWLQDDVVNVINNNATVTEEYINLTNELKTFVENYFDNLDVQEEINNKLDEMAEDGTLQEIIAEYIQANVAWSFNTIADMKLATNLIAGSYVETFGFYALNDKGGARYKVRNIINTDVVDEITIIALYDNNLVAELVIDGEMNVHQFGAKGDNSHDDIINIQKSLSYLNYAKLLEGTYLISSSISIGSKQSIFGIDKNSSVIKLTQAGNAITPVDSETTYRYSIHDLTVVGYQNNGYGLYLQRTSAGSGEYRNGWNTINNIVATGFDTGIYVGGGQNNDMITNIESRSNHTGIYFSAHDVLLSNLIISGNTQHGLFITNASASSFSNLGVYYNGSDGTDYYNMFCGSSSGINICGAKFQESYNNNINISYTNNSEFTNIYLSWAGLDKPSNLLQIRLAGCNNCKLKATSQNGHFGETGYDNYILGFQYDNQNCDIEVECESDFPANKKLYHIGSSQSYSLFTKNKFNITSFTNMYSERNYALNGDIKTTDLSVVNNSQYCSYSGGMLVIDTTSLPSGSAAIKWNIADLPEIDACAIYCRCKKLTGSGAGYFTLQSPCAVSIKDTDPDNTEYYMSFFDIPTSKTSQQIDMSVGHGLKIGIIEIGYVNRNSAKFNTPII